MRPLLSFVGGCVALLALLVATPLLWISTHIADEDGYVSFSSTLAKDSELQGAFAGYLSDELARNGILPAPLKPAATIAFTQVAGRTSNEPGFVNAWEETQRGFHRSAFAKPTPRVLALDIGPMATFVVKRVTDRLPITLSVPGDLVVPVASDANGREAVQRAEDTTHLGRIGAVIALVGALGCIAFARRTSAAVARLGIGTVVVAGLLWLASGPATQKVLDHTEATSDFARTLQKLLADRAADSLAAWLVVLALLGGIAAVTGFVGRAVAGRAG